MPHPYGHDPSQLALPLAVAARHGAEVDQKGRFPEESVAALRAAGLFGLTVPTDLGGLGQGARAFAVAAEELAGACASTAMVYVMHTCAIQAVASSRSLGDREKVLRAAARGQHLSTLALSEKGSRSQFWSPVSKLAENGDGFQTSAVKSWVTAANFADSYVSSAQAPGAESPLQSTIYLARTGTSTVRPQGAFDGLGLRGNDSSAVRLEGLKVSRQDLISEVGKGADTMLGVILPWFAVGTAAMAHGLCRAAVEATAGHLCSAGFDHTGTLLRELPQLRARLAQMSVRTEASRALLGRTLGEMESGSAEAPLFVLSARRAALEAALEVTDLALKACGGAAFSRQATPIERLFRDARAGWVMAPTADHLDDFIGKALTGLPLL
jgi:alkylation response protein AidB-like acyl-CoA dehydrogenase